MKVSVLDAEKRASVPAVARDWAARALSVEPVVVSQWSGPARRCYQLAGARFPDRVIRVPSPLALARTLFAARIDEVPGDEDRALVGVLRTAFERRTERRLEGVFSAALIARARREVGGLVDSAVRADAIVAAVADALYGRALRDDPPATASAVLTVARWIASRRRLESVSRRVPEHWRAWELHLGGQWEAGWLAYASFLTAASGEPGWQRRIDAFAAAQLGAGWWYPHLDFILVSDRPRTIHTEQSVDGSPGRPHSATGPAVVWRDGWALYFWHGTPVPEWVVRAPTVAAIHAEPNVEVRRCGIEALGWDTYVARAGLRLVDTAPDPGNAGFELRLYQVPATVSGEPTRVLLASNGSPERDGTRRRYGLPVPGDLTTAVHAAAWTYGVDADQYARLTRRT